VVKKSLGGHTGMTGNSFYSRKLHSLLGVIPIGFFLVEHFITNWHATKGNTAFIEQVQWINDLPFIFFLELFGIWLPLLYHGVYGLFIAFQSRNNVNNYGYHRNVMFMLQRVTGVVTLIFIVWHTWETRVQLALGNTTVTDIGELMVGILSNPLYFTFYLIGVVAATFHFCNGMWSFLVSWGITIGPRAQRFSTIVWSIAFFVIAGIAVWAMFGFIDPDYMNKGVEAHG
jgi:succinate dehydrogenase / fumarate reductase cytochrome b subunit